MDVLSIVRILAPEITLAAAALALITIETLVSSKTKWISMFLSIVSLLISLGFLIFTPGEGRTFGMLVADPFAAYFKILAVVSCIFVLLISEREDSLMGVNSTVYCALLLLSTLGTMLLSSAEDFLILFVGLELVTIPLFVLTGFNFDLKKSSEGAIKFFLMGAFSSGLMVFGISYIYGLCGSTHFLSIQDWVLSTQAESGMLPILFSVAFIFTFVGLGFKFSLVPFHQWVPDVYEGAPTPITAFFSVSRDAGVLAVLLRLFGQYLHQVDLGLGEVFSVLAILTMTLGNLTALRQTNLKRLLAYSSIAHAGTLFIGLVADNAMGREGAMLYGFAYLLMNIGAFSVVSMIARVRGSEEIGALSGLAKGNLGLAFLMIFFLLSLAGIPPFLGFWAKFYVFAGAAQAHMFLLVGFALINSVIAVAYYFKVAQKMFFENPGDGQPCISGGTIGWSIQTTTFATGMALLILGIFPETVLSWVRYSSQFLAR